MTYYDLKNLTELLVYYLILSYFYLKQMINVMWSPPASDQADDLSLTYITSRHEELVAIVAVLDSQMI
jgi:hypothetical protein